LPKLRFGPAARRAAAVGLGAYAVALLVTMPAAMLVEGAGGTIWSGSAPLPAGHRLDWHWLPLKSLTGLGFGLAWHVTGGDSDLAGEAVARPGLVRVEPANGALDAALPFAYGEALPFRCQFVGRLDLARAEIADMTGWGEGTMRTAAGHCRVEGGNDRPVPPMVLRLSRVPEGGSGLMLMTQDGSRALLTGAVTVEGTLRYSLTPLGAQLLPFAAPPGGAGEVVELDF
jgi:hypothetical protein